MIRSMTAYARRASQNSWGVMTWELRSVNHRYLEISLRLPDSLRMLEPLIRERIGKKLSRGKIDCGLRYQPGGDALASITLNEKLAQHLVDVAGELNHLVGPQAHLQTIDVLRWPGVVSEPETDLEPIKEPLLGTLDEALTELVDTRQREGQRTSDLLEQRCTAMTAGIARVRARRPEVNARVREKLLGRISDLPAEADAGRLEQELAIIAQRLDVDEELDRLDTHLTEVKQVLGRDEPVGRRLDFLMQELNREANTLSSKSADAETTQVAVDLKVLIEQMREQVQNIE